MPWWLLDLLRPWVGEDKDDLTFARATLKTQSAELSDLLDIQQNIGLQNIVIVFKKSNST